ncbi:hypothetical protein [Nocardioides dilutus]
MTARTPRPAHLLGLVLGVGLLAGCGDEPGLDAVAVADYLEQSQETALGELGIDGARCPDRALREGMTLPCTLHVADAEVPYRVRLRDVHAEKVRVEVTLDAVVLLQDRIQPFVVSTLSDDFSSAQVDCGHQVIVVQVGDTVECTVAAGAQTEPVVLSVEDEEGHVSIG